MKRHSMTRVEMGRILRMLRLYVAKSMLTHQPSLDVRDGRWVLTDGDRVIANWSEAEISGLGRWLEKFLTDVAIASRMTGKGLANYAASEMGVANSKEKRAAKGSRTASVRKDAHAALRRGADPSDYAAAWADAKGLKPDTVRKAILKARKTYRA
jgi:hypothetical protein